MSMPRQKELHDRLLAEKASNPELADAVHDVKGCIYCSDQGGKVTDEELRAAVEAEKAPLLAEIAQLKAVATTNKVETFLADARAEDAKIIEELRVKLDTAVLERAKAVEEYDALVETITQAEEDRKAEEALVTVRAERMAKVKEVASFPDKHIEENADRWARMPEEEFTSLLGDYALQSGTKPRSDKIPSQTAMVASRNHTNARDDMKELFQGVVLNKYIKKATSAPTLQGG